MYKLKNTITESYDNRYDECLVDFYLPEREESETPLLIFFHGGGIESGSRKCDYAMELAEHYGIAVASADYRMYPKAKFPDFIEDAASVCAYVLKKYGSKYKSIVIGGSSAGAYLSMMLYFAPEYLHRHGIRPEDYDGFIFDAGQPTTHFNVLRERGLNSNCIRVDEASPLFFIDKKIDNPEEKPPVLIINAEYDMENRREQTMLLMGVMKTFGYDMSKVRYILLDGFSHCGYCSSRDSDNEYTVNKYLSEFINSIEK